MDEDSENCCRLHGLGHEQREAQHGGGGGGDDVFPIQILHWPIKPFNLTYWECLYLKIYNLQNAWKICIFHNSKQFPWKKVVLEDHMSLLECNGRY